MSSRNDFNQIVSADQNDVFVADTDPLDLWHRPSVPVIRRDHERMELSSPNQITNLCQNAYFALVLFRSQICDIISLS